MLRKKLHKFGIYDGFAVVFSPEEVPSDCVREEKSENKRTNVGTISYMPAIFGCFAASVVIRDLIGIPAYEKLRILRPTLNAAQLKQLDKALEPFRPVVYNTTLDAAQAVNAAKATLKKLSGK